VILALDNDRPFKTAQESATWIGVLDPGIDRAVAAQSRRHMGGSPMNLAERVAYELLKTVLALGKLQGAPAFEIVRRKTLAK
jgi:hypothetical protein